MKFIVSSSALSKELQIISGVQAVNSTLPILEDFLFELKENELKITATDLQTRVSTTLTPDLAEGEGAITIPAKFLLDMLKTFSETPITFSIELDTLNVEITADMGNYKFSGHNGDEFPELPELDYLSRNMIPSSLLLTAFNKTVFATGNDQLRKAMAGVYCEMNEEDIRFVATDAHKLVRFKSNEVKTENATSFVLTKKPLNKLKNILPQDDTEVAVTIYDKYAQFSFDNIEMYCLLINEKYPNYEAVIPGENPNVLHIERVPFLNALRRVSIFGNQSTNLTKLEISGKELIISAEDIDFQNQAEERISCSYKGEDLEIGFSSRFIIEMLNNTDEKEIELHMSAPNRAGIIYPIVDGEKNEDILMLVMPVMLGE